MQIRAQRGMGFVTLFIILAIAGIATVAGMKIVPLYINDSAVSSAFENLAKQSDSGSMSKAEIAGLITKRLYINQLDDKIPLTNLKVETAQSGGKKVSLDYEARATVMGNLDAVATFSHSVVLR
jgi:hypothetical protein